MTSLTLNLYDEFLLLCILLGLDPKELLQNFVDAVVIPSEHFKPAELSTLATQFVVDYVREEGVRTRKHTEEQKAFLKKKESQYQTLRKNSGRYGAEESAEAMRFFLKLWLKEWEKGEFQGVGT